MNAFLLRLRGRNRRRSRFRPLLREVVSIPALTTVLLTKTGNTRPKHLQFDPFQARRLPSCPALRLGIAAPTTGSRAGIASPEERILLARTFLVVSRTRDVKSAELHPVQNQKQELQEAYGPRQQRFDGGDAARSLT